MFSFSINMANQVQYQNWWSKLLFRKKFENQFFIPLPVSIVEDRFFKWVESTKFSTGFDHIKIEKPIFIVGLPRSGTTLLYNLLCAHEQAAYVTNSMNSFPEALETIEWLRKKFRWNVKGERFLQDSIEVDFGSPSEPLTLWGKWMGRDPSSLFWQEMTMADLPKGRVGQIEADVKKMIRSFGGANRRFVVKYPLLQTELKLVQEIFPDAKFIHILRDPRMAANSLVKLYRLSNEQLKKIKHPLFNEVIPYPRVQGLENYIEQFGADSLECTAHIWNDSIDLVRATAPSLKSYYEIKYEDILLNPQKELRELFQFCDLAWPTTQNQQFADQIAKVGCVHHINKYSGFEKVEEITAPLMRELGYC